MGKKIAIALLLVCLSILVESSNYTLVLLPQ